MKVLTISNNKTAGLCQVDNITCKIDESEGIIMQYKLKNASASYIKYC